MRSKLQTAALTLCLAAPAAAQVPDAGPNLSTFHPASVRLQGSLQGGTPLVWYSADGNNLTEDHVVRSSSATGITSAVLSDGNLHFGWPSDFTMAGGVVWGSDVAKDQLYTVDLDTCLVTAVGAQYPAFHGNIHALAYDANLDQLFGVDLIQRQLLRVDRTSAATTKVGNQTLLAYPLIRGLAWRPSDQQLYAIDQTQNDLVRIDPVSGAATVVLTLPFDPDERLDSLAWVNDELYVNTSLLLPGAVQLCKVDLSDGSVDAISGVIPECGGHALFVDSLPEPVLWTQVSGPGVASFSDATVVRPLVSFSAPGAYVLELTVSAPGGPVSDRVTVFDDAGTGVAFCFGDGSGAACPCANPGAAGAGCANSTGQGALLSNQGGVSVGADDADLVTVDITPGALGIYFMDSQPFAGGLGMPFVDGLACAGGASVRYPSFSSGPTGTAHLTQPAGQWPALVTPGKAWLFQVWYRDVTGPCGQGSNLSNALAVTFTP